MTSKIGFVILSHSDARQLLRLVQCLRRIYDNPPIAVHHDFRQCSLKTQDFPFEVKFVMPSIATRWGHFSLVMATLRALKLLYDHATPEWFVFLSASDYPVMSADKVLEDLSSSGFDALLDYREVPADGDYSNVAIAENTALNFRSSPALMELAFRRYIGVNVWFPIVRNGPRIGRHTIYTSIKDWRAPFGQQFKCFCGDQWFAGNVKVANLLLQPTKTHLALQSYLRFRTCGDECYFHTVLANTQSLSISRATRRFAIWDGGTGPRLLKMEDLQAIIASNAYFARKLSPNTPVLDECDRMLN
jgi:hypothetical protein